MVNGIPKVIQSFAWVFSSYCILEINLGYNIFQCCRSYLLLGIRPCVVRVMVCFYHQTIQTEVDGPLRSLQNTFPVSNNMAGVIDHFHSLPFPFQVYRHGPIGLVTESFVIRIREASVDGSKFGDSHSMQSFQSTDPQLKIRIHGVFDHYRNVNASKGLSNFLYGKRIDSSPCTNPKHIHIVFERHFRMGGISHFSSDRDIEVMSDYLHPFQTIFTDSFKHPWPGTWFPNTCTEHGGNHVFLFHVYADFFDLFGTFCTAWTGNDNVPLKS